MIFKKLFIALVVAAITSAWPMRSIGEIQVMDSRYICEIPSRNPLHHIIALYYREYKNFILREKEICDEEEQTCRQSLTFYNEEGPITGVFAKDGVYEGRKIYKGQSDPLRIFSHEQLAILLRVFNLVKIADEHDFPSILFKTSRASYILNLEKRQEEGIEISDSYFRATVMRLVVQKKGSLWANIDFWVVRDNDEKTRIAKIKCEIFSIFWPDMTFTIQNWP